MAGATLTSTTTFSDVLKQVYEPVLQNLSVTESELWDLFTEQESFEVTEGPDGKQINMAHVFSYGGGVGAMGENDYVYASQDPNIKQSFINIKQWTATVEMSGKVMRRVREGQAAFATWAEQILPERIKRLAFHKDRALMGAGNGILFQLNGTPGSATGIAINNAFGISGLGTPTYNMYLGDSLRFSSAADGSGLRTGAAVVQNVHYAASTIDTDVLPTSSTSGDYVALGDANVNGFGTKENMGLLGIVDDGTVVPTFQGLSRTTYPLMQAQIVNAATANGGVFGGTFGEELLEFSDRTAYEHGLGKPDVIVCSRSARAAYWKSLKSDRRINDPAGSYVGGISRDGLRMIVGDRELGLKVSRKCPTSVAFMLQKDTLRMFRVGPGRWDDTSGSIWNRTIDTTGRKDAYYAVYIEEFEVASPAPNRNVLITNLAAA
jgi:hypothetical protein